MSEWDIMKQRLEETGVYTVADRHLIGAELAAYAAGLDPLFDALDELKRECFVVTAEGDGLTCRENWVRRMNLQDTLAGRREALIKALSVTAVDYTAEGMEKIRDSFQVHGSFSLDVSDLTLTFHCTDSLTVRQQAELEAQMRPLMPVWCRFVLTIENN